MDLAERVKANEIVFFQEQVIDKQSLLNFIPYISPDKSPPTHLKEFVDELEDILFRKEKKLITFSAPPQHHKTNDT